MKKLVVAIAMGGYSSEAEISIKSGNVVYESLSTQDYEVYCVYLLKDSWNYVTKSGSFEVDKTTFGCTMNDKQVVPDVIFNTIHGTPGEDGILAAYLDLIGIPQTSSGFYEAALSFNKRDCLSVLKNFGIHCATSVYHNEGEYINSNEVIKKVGLPCFVKPNRSGSSFGISKVSSAEMLLPAIALAYKEDREVLIESAVVGTEVSVGTYKTKGEIVSLSPTEIVSENDFFDYEAKYQGKSEEITPARISEEETLAVQEAANRIYKLLNMKGITRSDFIIQDGIPFFIEINTTPGLSKESIIPKQVAERGETLSTFFNQLIGDALK
jgi:D-alanine-D-alanine ligase